MTVSEKSPLLIHQQCQQSYVIPIPPEDNAGAAADNQIGPYALTKDQLDRYRNDPFWVKMRYICFCGYWLVCLVALLVSCYIAVVALENGICDHVISGENSSAAPAPDNRTIAPSTDGTITTTTVLTLDKSSTFFRMLAQPS